MGTVRCRFSLELHDQVLLHTETTNGVLFKTYLVNSMIKDVNTPISVLYRTVHQPYPDGTVLAVQADAAVSRGSVKAKAYEFEVQPSDLAVVVPAPYSTPPRLFFDAVILREIHSDSWTGRGGVFEIEVAVDFGDDDTAMQLDARCSLPRQKKAYKKLTELFTTQRVRVCGDMTGWVHANMVWLEVCSIDPLDRPPPGVGRKLDLSGRGRRSASPVKGVGRDGRRGRGQSPAKGLSPVRASSPVKELSSSFNTFHLRGRSTSPSKDSTSMGPPEYSPSRTIFAAQRGESHEQLLGSHPASPEPVKSMAIKPIPVLGRNANYAVSPDSQGTPSRNLLAGTSPVDAFNDIFSKFTSEGASVGITSDPAGPTSGEKSGLEFMKSFQETLAAGDLTVPMGSSGLSSNTEHVGNGSGATNCPQAATTGLTSGANSGLEFMRAFEPTFAAGDMPIPMLSPGLSLNTEPTGDVSGAVAPNGSQADAFLPAVNLAADVARDEDLVEEFLKSMAAYDTFSTLPSASLNPQGGSEKGAVSGSSELGPLSPGVWSF